MQLIKLQLEFCTEDNFIETWTLEGDEVRKWQGWIDALCVLAANRGENPDWSDLHWVKHRNGAAEPDGTKETVGEGETSDD
ncbi:MAG: hypothetical protein MSG64_02835 [Pyrinomonadaceae bacterium MAG19_C2-C3]|nr:hypothetical protein [Pyrinomonadaceae bacterium MAG19_C2-C3]